MSITIERLKEQCKGVCANCPNSTECYITTECKLPNYDTVEHIKFNTVQGEELTHEEVKFLASTIITAYHESIQDAQKIFKYIIELDLLGLIDRVDVRNIINRFDKSQEQGGDKFVV